MSDLENIRWCPACQHESLDGDERFCARCCKVFDKIFPGEDWQSMDNEDLIEHYHNAIEFADADLEVTEDQGIPPVADMNAPEKDAAKSGFLQEWGVILAVAAVVIIGLLIYFFL